MSAIRADLYLRLSDLRNEDQLDGREAKLRARAAELGWQVHRVVVENDVIVNGDGTVRPRPASAFKREKMITPSGRIELRVNRPRFRQVLADITSGAANALLAEDLDRVCRDPRDLEDLIDACDRAPRLSPVAVGLPHVHRRWHRRRDNYGQDDGHHGEQIQPGHRPPGSGLAGAAGREVLARRAAPVRLPVRPGRSRDTTRR